MSMDRNGQVTKQWFRPGDKVIDRSSGREMTVDHIMRKRHASIIDKVTNRLMNRMVGVRCSWTDAHGVRASAVFHTKELVRP